MSGLSYPSRMALGGAHDCRCCPRLRDHEVARCVPAVATDEPRSHDVREAEGGDNGLDLVLDPTAAAHASRCTRPGRRSGHQYVGERPLALALTGGLRHQCELFIEGADKPRRVAPGGHGPGRRPEAVLEEAAQLLAAQSNHEPKSRDRIGHPLHERDERCSTNGGEGLDRSR